MKSPLQAMRDLLSEDTRYKIEAYQFIRESLQYAQENSIGGMGSASTDLTSSSTELKELTLEEESAPRHVTGQQLCEACRLYALQQYGYLSRMVLRSWGIESSSDLGELVYNLIRIEQMHKSDTDRREDFDDVFDFATAFDPQFELATNGDE